MAKYRVGDRVKVRSWDSMKKEFGTDGCGCIKVPCIFTPEMKKFCGEVVTITHVTCNGYYLIDKERGWTFSDGMFEPGVIAETKHSPKKTTSTATSSDKVTIYAEDRKVIAVDKASGKTGVARCHPDDKFDFYLGAEIALERLKEQCKKPELYSGEIVCIKAVGHGLTAGKIYTVEDGKFVDDEGDIHGRIYPYTSFKDLADQHWSSFLEVIR